MRYFLNLLLSPANRSMNREPVPYRYPRYPLILLIPMRYQTRTTVYGNWYSRATVGIRLWGLLGGSGQTCWCWCARRGRIWCNNGTVHFDSAGEPSALWASHRPDPASGVKRADGRDCWDCSMFRVERRTVQASVLIREAVTKQNRCRRARTGIAGRTGDRATQASRAAAHRAAQPTVARAWPCFPKRDRHGCA